MRQHIFTFKPYRMITGFKVSLWMNQWNLHIHISDSQLICTYNEVPTMLAGLCLARTTIGYVDCLLDVADYLILYLCNIMS